MKKLLLATLAASALLTGCGKAPLTAPAVKAPARLAAQAAKLEGTLVVTRATSEIKEREGVRARQAFEVVGKLDGKPFSFTTSTFWPYYVPMLAGSQLNGQDDALKPETAKALLALFKAADATPAQKQAMAMLNYGLEFRSHHFPGNGDAATN